MTIRAFARKVGISHGALHKIENLQQSITIGKLGLIVDRLGLSYEDVLGSQKVSATPKKP